MRSGPTNRWKQFSLRTLLVPTFACAVCLGVIGNKLAREKARRSELRGDWRLTSLNGKSDTNPDYVYDMDVRLDGDLMVVCSNARIINTCEVTIDASKTPVWMDLTGRSGKRIECLVERRDDTLIMSQAIGGQSRLRSFDDARSGSINFPLLVLQKSSFDLPPSPTGGGAPFRARSSIDE